MTDTAAQLAASITDLGASIDRANLRLELTREALRALIDNEFAYLHLLAAIEGAVLSGRPLDELVRDFRESIADDGDGLRVVGSLDGLVK